MSSTETAGAASAPARILCTLDTASNSISGVRFALLPDGQRCSEPVDAAVAARFCSIPGYLLAPADLDVAPVDAALAAQPASESPSDTARLQVTISELERANLAMASDLSEERRRRIDAEGKLAKSEVPRLEGEIERLKRQVDEPSSLQTTLQAENQTLREANERLTSEVAGLRATLNTARTPVPPARRPAPGVAAQPPPA